MYTIVPGSHTNFFYISDDNWLVLAEPLTPVGNGQQLTVSIQASDDGVPIKSGTREYQFIVTEESSSRYNTQYNVD